MIIKIVTARYYIFFVLCISLWVNIEIQEALSADINDSVQTPTRNIMKKDVPDTMCGPNCLWQITSIYGMDYSIGAIRNLCGTTSNKGTSISGIVKACDSIGLKAKAVKTDTAYLERCPYTVLLYLQYLDIGHFAIMDKIENNQVSILDGTNYETLTLDQLRSIWQGNAILISDKDIELEPSETNIRIGTTLLHIGTGILIGTLIFTLVYTYKIIKKRSVTVHADKI